MERSEQVPVEVPHEAVGRQPGNSITGHFDVLSVSPSSFPERH
jgi:hypothetical protein